MKTKLFYTMLIVLSITLYSCQKEIIPSGKITKEQKSFTGYNSIEVSAAFTVYVNFSDTDEKIEVEADNNLHKYIIVETVSNKLIIRLENNISIEDDATLNVYITTKGITGFSASGASRFFLQDTLIANDINVDLSGASRFTGILEVKNLTTTLSGASRMNLNGHADLYYADASGASNIKDYAFETNYLNIQLSGASSAYLSVIKKMDVDASGASNLYYKGNGTIQSQHLSGASGIRKMD